MSESIQPDPTSIVTHDVVKRKKRRDLTGDQVKQVISLLLSLGVFDGKNFILQRGALAKVARDFGVCESNISNKWKMAMANYNHPDVRAFRASPQRKGNCGRNQLYDRDAINDALEEIEHKKRQSITQIAISLRISKTTFRRMVKVEKSVTSICIDVNPVLTEETMLKRVLYCEQRIIKPPTVGVDGKKEYYYDAGYNEVHVDKKWFYLTKPKRQRLFLSPREKLNPPRCSCSNKLHPPKLMYLAAVA